MLIALNDFTLNIIIASLSVIVLGPASFGITYMVSFLPGPFNIFHQIMRVAGIDPVGVYNDYGQIASYEYVVLTPDKFITKLFKCPHCLGAWIALGMTIIFGFVVGLSPVLGFFVWMSSYGILALMVERATNGQSV